jgi:hypothetical protein
MNDGARLFTSVIIRDFFKSKMKIAFLTQSIHMFLLVIQVDGTVSRT